MKTILVVLVLMLNAMAQPEFIAYSDGNPVIPKGISGSWDAGAVWAPTMSVVNDTFYLTYQGARNYNSSPMGIGLATSTDGYNFTKSQFNPILSGDGSGFDAYAVSGGILIYDNGSLVSLLFGDCGISQHSRKCYQPCYRRKSAWSLDPK